MSYIGGYGYYGEGYGEGSTLTKIFAVLGIMAILIIIGITINEANDINNPTQYKPVLSTIVDNRGNYYRVENYEEKDGCISFNEYYNYNRPVKICGNYTVK